jgi:undecaprenyl diphosphate synthase
MHLLLKTIKEEIKELHEENVRFTIIGDLETIPPRTAKGLRDGVEMTKNNSGLNLNLALNYGSRQEIISAIKDLAIKVESGNLKPVDINIDVFDNSLYTSDMPDPDLLIRTSGENRLSNFLLWQIAYTEIFMTEAFWPDFREQQLMDAIFDFQSRERRFGKLSKQV